MRRAATIFLAAVVAAIGAAGCGSSKTTSTSAQSTTSAAPAGAGGALSVSADPSGALMFQQKSLSTKAGVVTVNFTNSSPIMHDVVVQDPSGAEVGRTNVISSSKASFTATLKPGTYTFFCSVDGHKDAGMKGTITVK